MKTYITFLRGINVSGKNMIKMKELELLLNDLDFQNVSTYKQSGNVVFQYKAIDVKILEEKIHNAIRKKLDLTVPVIVLKYEDLNEGVAQNPYSIKEGYDEKDLYYTLLQEEPSLAKINSIQGNTSGDIWTHQHNFIYLYCPDGYGKTKWNNNFFEKKLALVATTRNHQTMMSLLTLGKEKNIK